MATARSCCIAAIIAVVGSPSWANDGSADAKRIISFFAKYSEVEGDVLLEYEWLETAPHMADPFSPPPQMPEGLGHTRFPVAVSLGTARLLYEGAVAVALSPSNPEPAVEPLKVVIVGDRSTNLHCENGKPSHLVYYCDVASVPGTDEYLFFSELFGRMPVGQWENLDVLYRTLQLAEVEGWKDTLDEGRVFVFLEDLSAGQTDVIREWHFKTSPRPCLVKRVTRSSSTNDPEAGDHVSETTFDWKQFGGHWIPQEISFSKYNENDSSESKVEQSIRLTSFRIDPLVPDSHYSIEPPEGVKVIDTCLFASDEEVTPRLSLGWVVGILAVGMAVAGFLWWKRSRHQSATAVRRFPGGTIA